MISCALYDHIEIVCMHQYPIKLTLTSGEVVLGTAIDTKRDNNKNECILIKQSKQLNLIILDTISVLEVMTDNPHFIKVTFAK